MACFLPKFYLAAGGGVGGKKDKKGRNLHLQGCLCNTLTPRSHHGHQKQRRRRNLGRVSSLMRAARSTYPPYTSGALAQWCGVWCVVCGVWCGVWCAECGVWCVNGEGGNPHRLELCVRGCGQQTAPKGAGGRTSKQTDLALRRGRRMLLHPHCLVAPPLIAKILHSNVRR